MLRNSADEQTTSSVTTESPNDNTAEALLTYYHNTSDVNRENVKYQLQQIDNDSLIAQYRFTANHEKSEFVRNLTVRAREVLFDHYLNKLQISAWNLQDQHHPGGDIANAIVTQLRSIRESKLQANTATRFSNDHFMAILHATTSFIQTPVLNQDKTANIEFSIRAKELETASANLRSTGKYGVLAGLLDTFLTLACIGGAVVLGLYTFGVIGAASALTKAIGPLAMGMETMYGVKYAVSAIGKFATAHRSLSVSNKVDALVKNMQRDAEPVIDANARPAL